MFPATFRNYNSSGFWPGTQNKISYLFSAEMLKLWYLMKHNSPSTSERKFIEALQIMAEGSKRGVIFTNHINTFHTTNHEIGRLFN